jgi:hypothetical protein
VENRFGVVALSFAMRDVPFGYGHAVFESCLALPA